jgi:hypothetical protein
MFERIINGMLREDVSSVLAKKYNVDASKARELMRKMDLSSYIDIKDAMDKDDTNKVRELLSQYLNTEANSYTVARQDTEQMQGMDNGENPVTDLSGLGTGSVVSVGGGDSKINDVSKLGSTTNMSTDSGQHISVSDQPIVPQAPLTNQDDAMAEIERIKQLAGIPDDVAVEEEIGSPTPMTCKAMSRDGSTTPNQIIKRHKKHKKPGPKTGSKHD